MLETDVVIGGWLPGEGRRGDQFGALVVGVHKDGELKYAGRVGTGFDERELNRLGGMLAELARDDEPVRGPPAAARDPLRRAGAGRPRRVWGVDAGRHAAPPALPRPARRHRPRRPWSSKSRETDRRHRRLPDRPRRDADVAPRAPARGAVDPHHPRRARRRREPDRHRRRLLRRRERRRPQRAADRQGAARPPRRRDRRHQGRPHAPRRGVGARRPARVHQGRLRARR